MTLRERPQHEDQQGDLKQDIRVTGKSTYHHQLDAVVELLSGQGTQITGGQDCVNNMRAIDSLYRAAGVSEFQQKLSSSFAHKVRTKRDFEFAKLWRFWRMHRRMYPA